MANQTQKSTKDDVRQKLSEVKYQVAVILPTYNEAENISQIVPLIADALKGYSFEIIVADDNSPDMTWKVADELKASIPTLRVIRRFHNRGLSEAVMEGMTISQSERICVMDADMQHDEKILPSMIQASKRSRLVVASRNIPGGNKEVMPLYRKLISNAGKLLSNFFLGKTVSDPMSGFFMITRTHFLENQAQINAHGFKILLEFLVRTPMQEIREVPYVFRERTKGKSKLNFFISLQCLIGLYEFRLGNIFPIQLFGYLCVGLSGLLVKNLVTMAMGRLELPVITAITAFFASVASNFYLNNRFVFTMNRLQGKKLLIGFGTYLVIVSLGLLIYHAVQVFLHEMPALHLIAALLAFTLSVLWNFYLSASLVWKVRLSNTVK